MARTPTYQHLFALLEKFGFVDETNDQAIVFHHQRSGTVLLYSKEHAAEDRVTNADLASTEHFLRENGIMEEPLLSRLTPGDSFSETPDDRRV